MNPDEFRDFQSEPHRENLAESTNPPKPVSEQTPPSDDPWGEFGGEEDEIDELEASLAQGLTEEDAGLLQAEDNFLQAFTEPEPVAPTVDLFATAAEPTPPSPDSQPGVDLFAAPSEPTAPAVNKPAVDLFATPSEPTLPLEPLSERSPAAPPPIPLRRWRRSPLCHPVPRLWNGNSALLSCSGRSAP